jgi:hypothetical protein
MQAFRIIPVLVMLAAVLPCGCGGEEGESAAKRAGDAVGGTLTDFASGVGRGIDKQMTVNAELSEELAAEGITMTSAKSAGFGVDGSKGVTKGITVYLIAARPLQGQLVAKAFDKDGLEVGRAVVNVEFAEDDAQYVTFTFPGQMDSQLAEKYTLGLRK